MPPTTPRSLRSMPWIEEDDVPIIDDSESLSEVVAKLSAFVIKKIDSAYTYEQLRTSIAGQSLRPLITSLSEECHHAGIVAALMTTRYVFGSKENDDSGLSESRALACELVAWQFLTFLSEKELIDYLLYELPSESKPKMSQPARPIRNGTATISRSTTLDETAPLIQARPSEYDGLGPPRRTSPTSSEEVENSAQGSLLKQNDDLAEAVAGMNALEIAAIANAKKFVAQKPVQRVVEDIWNGDIIFWEGLSVNAVKKARAYNKRVADPFTRLRVPKYQKTFQVAFFIAFLVLYYAVLVERNPQHIDALEILLYVWILAFGYDEFGELQDAGLKFYQTDFWSLWDVAIILVGAAFFVTRIVGLVKQSPYVIDISFDVLSLIALFLVPRIFSIFSLNPYFGSLIPVLKEMTKTFCKFLPVIIVLYLGFLTTFTMLARDRLTLNEMSWLLIKVFFGSSYLGFDVAVTISPLFGYTLMLIFVCLTNILLLTSLVSLVSNSLTEVMAHAREEYLFQYSIYVLESSTSRRLTYFMPPLNLIPLLLLRPLRLVFPSEDIRRIRIMVLKATHAPFVGFIWAYEQARRLISRSMPSALRNSPQPSARPLSGSQLSLEPERGLNKPYPERSAFTQTTQRSGTRPTPARTESVSFGTDTAGLVQLVQDLAAKVDSLTAMVAGQQRD